MKRIFFSIIIFFYALSPTLTYAQDNSDITTMIFIRHAEKDLTQSTNDPDLAPEGKERAQKIREMLSSSKIDAIYSTPYKRTNQTVMPLAEALNMEIQEYGRADMEFFDGLLQDGDGKTYIIAGHSNTIPDALNYLTSSNDYKIMGEGEYGKLFIVTTNDIGKTEVLVLNY